MKYKRVVTAVIEKAMSCLQNLVPSTDLGRRMRTHNPRSILIVLKTAGGMSQDIVDFSLS